MTDFRIPLSTQNAKALGADSSGKVPEAWRELVTAADSVPIPGSSRLPNGQVDSYESAYLTQGGAQKALLSRAAQAATDELHALVEAATHNPVQITHVDATLPAPPTWHRQSAIALDAIESPTSRELAERAIVGARGPEAVASGVLLLSDLEVAKPRVTGATRERVVALQRELFGWQLDASQTSASIPVYANAQTGVSVELARHKQVKVESLEPIGGSAYVTRTTKTSALRIKAPVGSKVLLVGNWDRWGTPPKEGGLSLVATVGQDGVATFDSWFRYDGKVYVGGGGVRAERPVPADLRRVVGFLVVAPAQEGSAEPVVLDHGALELPPHFDAAEGRERAPRAD